MVLIGISTKFVIFLKYLGRNVKLSMLDLLLSMELNGQIDDDGIREEVDTFIFEVTY